MPTIDSMTDDSGLGGVSFRNLLPDEGRVVSEAIRIAYGDSYDVRWVYDPDEVSARLAAGTCVSFVAEAAAGELLCHEGMSLAADDIAVASEHGRKLLDYVLADLP
jgi:hypothetical protein